jgi:hypothetical protein
MLKLASAAKPFVACQATSRSPPPAEEAPTPTQNGLAMSGGTDRVNDPHHLTPAIWRSTWPRLHALHARSLLRASPRPWQPIRSAPNSSAVPPWHCASGWEGNRSDPAVQALRRSRRAVARSDKARARTAGATMNLRIRISWARSTPDEPTATESRAVGHHLRIAT